MNNLKFRAWGAKNPYASNEKTMFTDIEIGKPFTDLNDFLRDRDLIFMQSTGQFDENGKEIFEGDIIETPNGNSKFENIIMSVEYPFITKKSNIVEVIGNIFDVSYQVKITRQTA